MSNINGDLLDEGLQAVMGKERCQDVYGTGESATEGPEIATSATPPRNDKCVNAVVRKDNGSQKVKREPDTAEDASWVKVNVVSPMGKLKCCAKWAMLFGSVSGLLFYWQQAGLLDPKAAVPSLLFCFLGAGLTIGYHAR